MFVPKEGSQLTVQLPGEKLRALVARIVDHNTVIVELTGNPLSRSHQYKKADLIAVKRARNMLEEIWEAIEERRTLPAGFSVEKEKPNAVAARKKPKSNKPKHSGNGSKRLPAKAGRGGKPVKRATKPVGKRGKLA